MDSDQLYILNTDDSDWNRIINKFDDSDIYHTKEYNISLKIHGDGEPLLIYYKNDIGEVMDIIIVSDISNDSKFSFLEKNKFFDCETPYGYGGPIVQGNLCVINEYYDLLQQYCKENNIISEFIRFHPLIKNQNIMIDKNFCDLVSLKETVFMRLEKKEQILADMDGKNRNMIRKAQKNDIKVFFDNGEHIDDFFEIYNKTMDKNGATNYYYFEMDYFNYLKQNLKNNLKWFYAEHDGKIISASIIMFYKNKMHYHLSGTLPEYRNFAANNLLLYEAALWGVDNHLTEFHLGGGLNDNDSLFSFKKKFNKSGTLPFYIGRFVFNDELFNKLIILRSEFDKEFNLSNNFLIKYRG